MLGRSRLRCRASRGLTLVELVVVLVILAALAATAISSTEGLVEESRREESERELANVEDALLGAFDQQGPAARPTIAGFVSDVGRLPKAPVDLAAPRLSELWLPPAGVAPFAIQSPTGDPELRLPGGWRGPYLRLGVGATELRDGWARTYVVERADGTAAQPGEELAAVRSFGADGIAGGVDYDLDLAAVIHRTVAPVQNARHLGAIPVRVRTTASSGFVVVRVYGPIDGTVRTLRQHVVAATGADATALFADLPVGARVVRAYATNDDPTPTPDAPIASATSRSYPVPVALVQGGVAEIELVLP